MVCLPRGGPGWPASLPKSVSSRSSESACPNRKLVVGEAPGIHHQFLASMHRSACVFVRAHKRSPPPTHTLACAHACTCADSSNSSDTTKLFSLDNVALLKRDLPQGQGKENGKRKRKGKEKEGEEE